MSGKKTTSTVSHYGGRTYKCSAVEAERKINEEKFLSKLRKLVYSPLDIPTRCNIIYSNAEIFDLVCRASLRHAFIHDTSNSINRKAGGKVVADAETVMLRLKKLGEEEWVQKWRIANKKMLKMARKQRLIPAMPSLSVDIHPIPFYGDKKNFGVMGNKPMKGTCKAFKYLSGCLSDCQAHLTMDSLPLKKGIKLWDALEELLITALQYVDHRFLVYMDREFYSTPVVNLMEKYDQKYLMPAKKTAPVKQLIEENEAPCVLPYTMEGKYGTADTTIVLVKNKKGEVKAFATNLSITVDQAQKLFDMYENRWTVDTSYRMVGQVRMNTASVNYAVRWFLFFFGLLIKNCYWLFNDFIKKYDHVTLITFAEMLIEVSGALFEVKIVKRGDG